MSRVARSAAACVLALLWCGLARADSTLEAAIKDTYLYKMAQFVSWPAGALPPTDFVLCVVGHGQFASLLDQAVEGQKVQQRPIVVRRYDAISSNPGCQLLYIPDSGPRKAAEVLARVRGTPVLTVTNDAQGEAATGIVNFVLMNGRVRFEINRQAAAANGLAISSKLLSLAVQPPR